MKKLFRKARKALKKATSSKVGKFVAPLAVGAVPYLVAKGAVSATGRRGSIADRARAFGHGAAGGTLDYFRNPVIRAAGEVLPGVKPLSQATERAALVAQQNLDPRRRGPMSARQLAQAGVELGQAAGAAAGYSVPIPAKMSRTIEEGRKAAEAIERGSRKRKDLRKALAGSKALARLPTARATVRASVRSNVRRMGDPR